MNKLATAALLTLTASLAACAPAGDEPTYLFGLTETEITEATARYAPGADIDHALWQMEAPFDCARFDDLCADVGPEAGLELLRSTWDLARSGADADGIARELDTRISDARERWFEVDTADEIAPDGIGSTQQGLWNGCGSRSNIAWAYNGRFSLRVRSGVTNLVLYVSTWTNSQHYRDGSANAERQCVEGEGHAYVIDFDQYASLSYGPNCKSRRKVTANANWVSTGNLYADYHSEGCGSGNGMRACACR